MLVTKINVPVAVSVCQAFLSCLVILEVGGGGRVDEYFKRCVRIGSQVIQIVLCLARRLPQEQAESPTGNRTLVRPKQAEEHPKRSCCSEK